MELSYNKRAVQRITENNFKGILGDSEWAFMSLLLRKDV